METLRKVAWTLVSLDVVIFMAMIVVFNYQREVTLARYERLLKVEWEAREEAKDLATQDTWEILTGSNGETIQAKIICCYVDSKGQEWIVLEKKNSKTFAVIGEKICSRDLARIRRNI